MKLRILTAALALSSALAPAARAQTDAAPQADTAAPRPVSALRIDLNIPENRLRLYDGDSVVKTYRVSVGLPGHDTPDGRYTIDHAEWNPWWRPPQGREWARGKENTPPGPNNPMGRVKLFFAPYYYIHGSPEVRDLGTPASHGCVRMMNRDVVELARTIHERNGGSVGGAEITRLLARPSQTRWSQIGTPVPLVIRYDPVVVRDDTLRIYPDFYKRNAVHTESVVQALMAAGYEAQSIDRAGVRQVIEAAGRARGVYAVSLAEAFAGLRPAPVPRSATR
ncbi:MAG TPA: L,D-transpeptidase [Longimicrobium sp.]|nr:L,D-transpeptidase [Longimicrobium sp.]